MRRDEKDADGTSTGSAVDRPFGLLPMERSRNLSARAADRIIDRILELDLRPGDRLPSERELGLEMGASRTVVREAVRSLVGRGIVQARHGRGLFVAVPTGSATRASVNLLLKGDIEDRYDKVRVIRHMLEVDAAGRAARAALPEDLAAMEQVLDRQARASAQHDIASAARADVNFHLALAAASQNELFPFLLEALGDVMMEIRVTSMLVPGDLEEGVESHSKILSAVRDRNPARARGAMRAHLAYSERVMSAADRSLGRKNGRGDHAEVSDRPADTHDGGG
jgi:GntR family transcriptional regulator, transcriptional repressor for pyruvate dehydrogenase complex